MAWFLAMGTAGASGIQRGDHRQGEAGLGSLAGAPPGAQVPKTGPEHGACAYLLGRSCCPVRGQGGGRKTTSASTSTLRMN